MKRRQLTRLIEHAGFVPDRPSQRHERWRKGTTVISLGRHDAEKPWEERDALKKIKEAEWPKNQKPSSGRTK